MGGNQVWVRSEERGLMMGSAPLEEETPGILLTLCHLQARKRALTRSSTDLHLELELPASGTPYIPAKLLVFCYSSLS